MSHAIRALVVVLALPPAARAAAASHPVKSLKITVLSTMLSAHEGVGEWGFAALVEVDGRRILFDTGGHPRTVLDNARALEVDLTGVTDVVLSHNHQDHTGGLVTLRRELARGHPAALARAHVGAGIFDSRPDDDGREGNSMIAARRAYEATGAKIVEHREPVELAPGVWLTGPIPRVSPERNYPQGVKRRSPAGLVADDLPEDQALVIDTDKGLVVLTGCGHAGIVNTITYARKVVRDAPVFAALGGFHLFAADDATLAWTGDELARAGVVWLLGAHCTGIEAVYRLRERAHLDRRHAAVGEVAATFDLERGLDPGVLAR